MTSISAKAVATVTIEFDVGLWNGETSFRGSYLQIQKEAKQILENHMKMTALKIHGDPEIKFITFEQ